MNAKNEFERTDDIVAETVQTKDQESRELETAEPGGWDPVEVWRTRVLRPRLRSSAATTERAELEAGDLTAIAVTARS